MSLVIPTAEPERQRAGDTWQWRREDLSVDYPATTWTLKYQFKNVGGGFAITAAADGLYFEVEIAHGTTAAYAAGEYDYVAWVEDATQKFTIGTGRLVVEPDLRANDAGNPLDVRSHARRMLAAIEASLEGRADSGQLELVARAIAGRSMQRDPTALQKLRDIYRHEARREEQAERAAAGLPTRRGVFVRFGGA